MENKSLWLRFMRFNKVPSLKEDIKCDVLIIGGGMAGLNTAYFLMNKGLKIVLIDKDACGKGVSAHTTGKLTFMQELVYHKIESNYSSEIAQKYLESQKEAIRLIRTIITKNKIDCNLENTSSYVFTTDLQKVKAFKLEEEFYKKYDIRYKVGSKLPICFPSSYTLRTSFSSVFHPVKYMLELKKILLNNGIAIYEDTLASSFCKKDNGYLVKANDFNIESTYVVVASHYPFFVLPGLIPLKTTVERSYIASGLVNKPKNFQAISYQDELYSIRYHQDKQKNYLLLVTNSHMINKQKNSVDEYHDLLKKYRKLFNLDVKYYWTNHDLLTYDSLPLIGRINDQNKNLFILTGFNTWGMTNSVIGGKVISDLILNKDNPYIDLFNPKRSLSKDKIKNIVSYGLSTSKSYLLSKINKNHSFYKEDVLIIHKDGKSYGIYIDKKGVRHTVNNTCPHMKCSLIFNYVDKTWDCPCHASRFDLDGKLLYGPSTKDITVHKNCLTDDN